MVDIRPRWQEENTIFLHCDCGAETITISKYPENERVNPDCMWSVDIDIVYGKSFWKRLKFAWGYLWKNRWYGIDITDKQMDDFIESLIKSRFSVQKEKK